MSEPLTTGPRDMANTAHLSAELVRRFLEQQVSVSERQAVVRHLVTQCPECLALTGRITAEGGYWFGAGAEAFLERDYTEAFEAASKFTDRAARRIAVERLCGWGHWSVLDPLLPNERLPAVVIRKDWHRGLFRALLDAARWYSSRDPQEAADIAQLGLDVVDLLDPLAVGGEAAAKDMRAKAWMILGNCRRLASDLDGAREAIAPWPAGSYSRRRLRSAARPAPPSARTSRSLASTTAASGHVPTAEFSGAATP
jgi:hypothetical protein